MFQGILHYPTFFLSLTIGIFLVYIICPKKEIVQKFPSPYNAGKIVYKDEKADRCYVYKADKSVCPADKKLTKPQPRAW